MEFLYNPEMYNHVSPTSSSRVFQLINHNTKIPLSSNNSSLRMADLKLFIIIWSLIFCLQQCTATLENKEVKEGDPLNITCEFEFNLADGHCKWTYQIESNKTVEMIMVRSVQH